MSEIVQTQAPEEPAGPNFELGSVNVDSLMGVLNRIGDYLPFTDEVTKIAYHEQVSSLNKAGDPSDPATAAGEAEIADLESKVAELQAELDAAKSANAATTPTAETNAAENRSDIPGGNS
jgi:hypothetical protein